MQISYQASHCIVLCLTSRRRWTGLDIPSRLRIVVEVRSCERLNRCLTDYALQDNNVVLPSFQQLWRGSKLRCSHREWGSVVVVVRKAEELGRCSSRGTDLDRVGLSIFLQLAPHPLRAFAWPREVFLFFKPSLCRE
jgi:hypothetical protein